MLATDENGMNSIRISAAHDDKDMLYLMMESFSSRHSKDLRPLLAMLRREGAEKYSVNVGIAALELTIQSGDLNFILTAVSHGVDVNVKAPSRRNYNPLLYACYKGDAQAIHRLIAHGADVNVFEDDGW